MAFVVSPGRSRGALRQRSPPIVIRAHPCTARSSLIIRTFLPALRLLVLTANHHSKVCDSGGLLIDIFIHIRVCVSVFCIPTPSTLHITDKNTLDYSLIMLPFLLFHLIHGLFTTLLSFEYVLCSKDPLLLSLFQCCYPTIHICR